MSQTVKYFSLINYVWNNYGFRVGSFLTCRFHLVQILLHTALIMSYTINWVTFEVVGFMEDMLLELTLDEQQLIPYLCAVSLPGVISEHRPPTYISISSPACVQT